MDCPYSTDTARRSQYIIPCARPALMLWKMVAWIGLDPVGRLPESAKKFFFEHRCVMCRAHRGRKYPFSPGHVRCASSVGANSQTRKELCANLPFVVWKPVYSGIMQPPSPQGSLWRARDTRIIGLRLANQRTNRPGSFSKDVLKCTHCSVGSSGMNWN